MDSSTVDTISLDIKQVRNLRNPGQTFDQALLAWDAPVDTAYLLDYEITGPGLEPFRTRGLEYTATGLTPDVPYLFHVQARRSQGSPAVPASISVVTLDRVPPTRPQDLELEKTTPSNAMLSWSPSKDNVAVVGYEVRRNGGAWIPCLVTQYPVAHLQPDEKFEVRAVDGSDNRSRTATVVNNTPTVPTKPANLRVTNDAGFAVTLKWNATNADYYDIYCNGNWNQTITENVAVVADLNNGATYTFMVRAADFSGNYAESDPLLVTTKDITAPSRPTNFRITSVTDNSAFLEWDESIDNVGIIGYQIFRNGTPGPTMEETSYLAADLAQGTTYTFIVRARDAAGNHADSYPLAVTLEDTIAPSKPANLRATTVTSNSAFLEWDESIDNAGIIGYQIFSGSTPIITVTGTSYHATGLAENAVYIFKVRALDAAGNFADSEPLRVHLGDRPPKPTNLRITNLTGNSATLEWAPGPVQVTDYGIWCNDELIDTIKITQYIATGLAQSTPYTFKVLALTASGHSSEPAVVEVFLPDTTAPSKPTDFKAAYVSHNFATLDWKAGIDNVGVTRHILFRDDEWLANIDGADTYIRYTATSLASGSKYIFKICAVDAAGNTGDFEYLTVHTSGLNIHPPTNLEFFRISNRNGTIQWEPPIESDGVTGYLLSRDGDVIRELSGLNFIFTDLREGVTHLFEVRAIRDGMYSVPASITG
jgi:chitodextrinase